MTAVQDPAFLTAFGATPGEASARLRREIDTFEEAARSHEQVWLTPCSDGAWSPAQLTEHVLLANESFGKVIHLLGSGRALPEVPHTPGHLVNGRAVAPPMLQPGPGLPWHELAGRWQEVHARLLRAARTGASPGRTFWHPYFGALDALGWTRVAAWHTRHHRRQLP